MPRLARAISIATTPVIGPPPSSPAAAIDEVSGSSMLSREGIRIESGGEMLALAGVPELELGRQKTHRR
jgi:hypothetical protein